MSESSFLQQCTEAEHTELAGYKLISLCLAKPEPNLQILKLYNRQTLLYYLRRKFSVFILKAVPVVPLNYIELHKN